MNCTGCFNLENKVCKLGKQTILGALRDANGDVVSLNYDCIFKNTEHSGFTFDMAHKVAMTRIAIATYFIVEDKEDIETLYDILDKEKDYGTENLIGQFNVIIRAKLTGKETMDICNRMRDYNGKRLWNVRTIIDGQPLNEYILETCKLPYFCELISPSDLADIQNFKFRCFCDTTPESYNFIVSINQLRKMSESRFDEIPA